MPQQILDLFPLDNVAPKNTESGNEIDHSSERLKRMGEGLVWKKPMQLRQEEDPEIQRAGNSYRCYRSFDSLPENAREFHIKAG